MPQNELTQPAIEMKDIHKSFGENNVLGGVNFNAKKGEVVSLIGGSGSGKSTLLRCIKLLTMPDKGEVHIDGQCIPLSTPVAGKTRYVTDSKRSRSMQAEVGMVFQQFNLWSHLTVLQNIIEGPVQVKGESKKASIEVADELLERVGLADKRNAYPATLSGGQQQRVGIARMLAMNPKAMLFDEPTSALDPEMVGEVLQVILDLAAEGRTMIVVTHEIGFAREVSDRIIFLNSGKIVEQGPADQVVDSPQSEECRQFLAKVR